nr:protease inhibitor I42 family protein [Legionella tunisiensis]
MDGQKYDKSFLQLIASHYISPQTKLMGAGGQMQFKFELVEGKIYPKNTSMLFKYARPWEPDTGTLKM